MLTRNPQDAAALIVGDSAPSAEIPLEEVDSPILRQGIAYWRELCAGRPFPAREEVNPRGLAALLRYTSLLRVVDGGRDYEYRIVGDAFVVAHGVSIQGKLWSDTGTISPGYTASIKPFYDNVVRRSAPLATRGFMARGPGAETNYSEYAFLPLGSGGKVDHILVFAVHLPRNHEADSA